MSPPAPRNLLVHVVCLTASIAQAAENREQWSDLTADYFLGDAPVVLSASRLAQPVSESPAAMTVIDREVIEASGAITIPDVLRLVPGFQVSHISGANLTAQYHGLANQHPKRMQVLIDGRSVYHSAFGGVHWDTLPITLDDIDRIEVLRGSNASSYGSNAFMGVVNIVTRHASRDQGDRVSLLTGYDGTRMATWRHGDRVGRLDYRVSLSAFETDGFPNHRHTHTYWDSTGGPVAPSSVVTGTPLAAESVPFLLTRGDSQSIGRFNFRGDYLMENDDSLLFEIGYVRNDRDNSLLNGNYDLLHPDENLRSSSQLLKWTRSTPSLGELSVQLSHNRLAMDTRFEDIRIERFGSAGAGGYLANFGLIGSGHRIDNDRYDVELQHTPNEIAGWRLVWGGGVRLDSVDGENFVVGDQDVQRLQYRLFANTEKVFGSDQQWVFNAGVMLEHHQDLGNFASPRIALNYHLDAYNTLRIAGARAYRMPSMFEQFGETGLLAAGGALKYLLYSNRGTQIDPETITSVELGLISANWLNGLTFDARVFREELRDYIDEVRYIDGCSSCDSAGPALGLDPHDLYVHENAGWLNIEGVDLQFRYNASDRTFVTTAASLVRSKGERVKSRNANGSVAELAYIGDYVPTVTLSALVSHRFDDGWTGSLGYYRMSKMNWPNEGDRLDPYDRLDLRVARKIRLGRGDAQVELIVQNARNQEYIEFRDDNSFERRVFLRLSLDFE